MLMRRMIRTWKDEENDVEEEGVSQLTNQSRSTKSWVGPLRAVRLPQNHHAFPALARMVGHSSDGLAFVCGQPCSQTAESSLCTFRSWLSAWCLAECPSQSSRRPSSPAPSSSSVVVVVSVLRRRPSSPLPSPFSGEGCPRGWACAEPSGGSQDGHKTVQDCLQDG